MIGRDVSVTWAVEGIGVTELFKEGAFTVLWWPALYMTTHPSYNVISLKCLQPGDFSVD